MEGQFRVGADLKASVEGIEDEEITKAIGSQLWEVCIHRVRRSFEQTHGANTFTAGDTDAVGLEVIVGGKNAGDRYRIKDSVVTMVHRHIHGTVVTIFTRQHHRHRCRLPEPHLQQPLQRSGHGRSPRRHEPLHRHLRSPGRHRALGARERVINSDDPEAPGGSSVQTFRFEALQPLPQADDGNPPA